MIKPKVKSTFIAENREKVEKFSKIDGRYSECVIKMCTTTTLILFKSWITFQEILQQKLFLFLAPVHSREAAI